MRFIFFLPNKTIFLPFRKMVTENVIRYCKHMTFVTSTPLDSNTADPTCSQSHYHCAQRTGE